ncbi:hypothetical protein AK830_g12111 [Neonectria ditissima]|uniref:Zinc-binding loop region of homing endonuclease domain-containing protein n=1 Tax=Neonectria ditissima TaxID=78410 RepID=A0A0P7B3Y1_9HYPO|nr:hypothetical protein AK830_g12111 [Neonectria ditissima]
MSRAVLNIMTELGVTRARTLVQRKNNDEDRDLDTITGCWLSKSSATRDGYCQVTTLKNSQLGRRGQRPVAFLLHKVSFVAHYGRNPTAGNHVSHLCDRRNCFNPEHLIDESPQLNNGRKNCIGPVFCSDHGNFIFSACPDTHQPPCIRPPRTDVRCCLSLKESDPQGWRSRQSSLVSGGSRPSRQSSRTDHQSTTSTNAPRGQPEMANEQAGRVGSPALERYSQTSTVYSGADALEEAIKNGDLDATVNMAYDFLP